MNDLAVERREKKDDRYRRRKQKHLCSIEDRLLSSYDRLLSSNRQVKSCSSTARFLRTHDFLLADTIKRKKKLIQECVDTLSNSCNFFFFLLIVSYGQEISCHKRSLKKRENEGRKRKTFGLVLRRFSFFFNLHFPISFFFFYNDRK